MNRSWTSGVAPEEQSDPDEHGQKYDSHATRREHRQVLDTHATCGTLAASTKSSSVNVYDAFDDDVSAAEATHERGS